jgi:benzodiazapine receptor
MQNNSPPAAVRLRQILVVIATAGVIFINYLAGTGYINNTTPGEVSDRYLNFLTPSGYAFSIWSLIYLGLAAFSIYQALPAQAASSRLASIRTLYIANCAANISWLYLWHHNQILPSLVVIFLILLSLVLINGILRSNRDVSNAEKWLVDLPFNIYFGWITVAAIVNFTVALVYLEVKTTDFLTTVSACILIVAATLLGIVIRLKFVNAAYPLTIAWALTAIAVKQSGKTMIVTCAALGVAALLISALSVLIQTKNQQK